jgi:hypothetical protein
VASKQTGLPRFESFVCQDSNKPSRLVNSNKQTEQGNLFGLFGLVIQVDFWLLSQKLRPSVGGS